MEPIAIQHIVSTPGVCGGKPRVDGTRIRVWDIHVWHDLRGQSAAEILAAFPSLTLADVYAALAYCHDHLAEIDAQIKRDDDAADEAAAVQGATWFTRVRDSAVAN